MAQHKNYNYLKNNFLAVTKWLYYGYVEIYFRLRLDVYLLL